MGFWADNRVQGSGKPEEPPVSPKSGTYQACYLEDLRGSRELVHRYIITALSVLVVLQASLF